MAIANRIEEMYTHVGDVYDTITNVELPEDKNIENIPRTIKDSYLEMINNGTQQVWDNWEKVSGTGETLTLNNTEEAPMSLVYKGNTLQNGTPTPDSPVPIQVVSGDNTINVESENLLDEKGLLNATFTTGVYKYTKANFKGNRTLYFKAQLKSGKTALSGLYVALANYGSNPNSGISAFSIRNGEVQKSGISNDFTGSEDLYISFYPTSYTWEEINNTYDLWVCTQSDTTYSEYQGQQSYPISLGDIELLKIGTYQDKIFKNTPNTTDYDSNLEDNVWYLKKEIGKVVLNGSENWQERTNTAGNKQFYVGTTIPNVNTTGSQYCTHFATYKAVLWNYGVVGDFAVMQTPHQFCGVVSSDLILADFKTSLGANNLIAYYILETPTYTLIEDTTLINQLETIKKSYEGQTNISQVNNDMPFELDVEALKGDE